MFTLGHSLLVLPRTPYSGPTGTTLSSYTLFVRKVLPESTPSNPRLLSESHVRHPSPMSGIRVRSSLSHPDPQDPLLSHLLDSRFYPIPRCHPDQTSPSTDSPDTFHPDRPDVVRPSSEYRLATLRLHPDPLFPTLFL